MCWISVGELEKLVIVFSFTTRKMAGRLKADSEQLSCQSTGVAGPEFAGRPIQLDSFYQLIENGTEDVRNYLAGSATGKCAEGAVCTPSTPRTKNFIKALIFGITRWPKRHFTKQENKWQKKQEKFG